MRLKAVLNGVLLGFVALCVAGLVAKNLRRPVPPAAGPPTAAQQEKLIVYCFHATVRCPLCLNMEAYHAGSFAKQLPRSAA